MNYNHYLKANELLIEKGDASFFYARKKLHEKVKHERRSKNLSKESYLEKLFIIQAAKDLGYGEKTIQSLKASQDTKEMTRIMETARNS